MGHAERDGPKLLFHLSPKNERSLIEQDVAALTIDPGKEHRLDQSVPIIEGRKLHRLIAGGVYRLGSREHARCQDVTPDVLLQLRAPAQAETPKLLRMKLHRVCVGHKPQRLVFLPAAALGGIFPQGWHGGW